MNALILVIALVAGQPGSCVQVTPAVHQGQPAVACYVATDTPVQVDTVVTLTTSDGTALTVPATVTIPAGEMAAVFYVTAPANQAAVGKEVVITATFYGYGASSAPTRILTTP